MSEPIIITVERYRYGHESCLREARVTEGPAYVRAHHTADTLAELSCSLAETGHAFEVRIEDRDVSLIDFMAATGRADVEAFRAGLDAPLGEAVYSCDGCGHPENDCRCDRPVEGYECGKCGYTPTKRELDRGSCPGCS